MTVSLSLSLSLFLFLSLYTHIYTYYIYFSFIITTNKTLPAEEYSKKIGRWIRESDKDMHSRSFWRDVYSCHHSRSPATHMENFLQANAGKPIMTALVTCEAENIGREWEFLLSDAAAESVWGPYLAFAPENSDEAVLAHWLGLAVHDLIEMYTDYYLRILVPMRRFPYSLLWMIYKPPDEPCCNRKNVCRLLLTQTSLEIGDMTTLKVRACWYQEIQDAADTGKLDHTLHALLTDIDSVWMADSQDIEGTANIVKHVGFLSNRMDWELLSNRVTI